MAFWNKKGPENLSINPDRQEAPAEGRAERPHLSGAERAANFRKTTWHKLSGAFKRTAEIGKKLVGGFDRVAGKGIEGYDAAKAGVAKGAEAFQSGMDRLYDVDVPEWLTERAVAGAEATGRGIKKGVEIGVGAAVLAGEVGYKAGKLAGQKGVEYGTKAAVAAREAGATAVDWTDRKVTQGKEWVGAKYEGMKDWAGGQADNIRDRAHAAKETFRAGVERVKTWKNQAVDAYHQNRFEAHFKKLSPEAQSLAMSRLEAIRGGQDLKAELSAA